MPENIWCIEMKERKCCGNKAQTKDHVICIGTALIDSIIRGLEPNPVSEAGYRADSCSLNVGGEAVNEAIAFVKLGVDAQILCFLGEDSAGRLVAETLREQGVDTSRIVWEKHHPTPVTTMFVNTDGTRKSITNAAHRYNFHPEQYCGCFEQAKAIILGSLFRAPFDDVRIIADVIAEAKKQGLPVFADTKLPNYRKLSLQDLAEVLPMIDYITPNEDEAGYYSGEKEPEAMADVFLSYGIRNVVIKLGSKGCYFKNPEFSLHLPPYEIKAVDATGAGDNFIAGLASELLNGSKVREALRFANACGAVCTTAIGAGTGLRNREQILALIRKDHPVS